MKRCSVLSTGQLQTDHVTAVERLHTPVTVDRRCADLAELIAAAKTTRADSVLIIGSTEKLTAAVVTSLVDLGLTVVVVSDVAAERRRLTSLGVISFTDDVAPAELAEALTAAHPRSPSEAEALSAGSEQIDEFAELMHTNGFIDQPESEHPDPEVVFADEPSHRLTQRAGVTAVWGAAGSPGRTTLAVNMAAELALAGARTLLIDADTYASAVAVHLGLMHESAGLAQACRAADLGKLDPTALAAAATTVMLQGRRLAVLTGLPRAQRWTEVRAHALTSVLRQARSDYDHIIVDLAPWIEQDDALAVDSHGAAAQRNAATRTLLDQADTVVALGGSDPVGFSRLIKAVQDLRETLPQAPHPQVVVGQLRKEVIGRSPRQQLSDAWQQLGPGGGIHGFLPWDRQACDTALRAGEALAESSRESPLRHHIAALAGVDLRPRPRLLPWKRLRRRRRGFETPAPKR